MAITAYKRNEKTILRKSTIVLFLCALFITTIDIIRIFCYDVIMATFDKFNFTLNFLFLLILFLSMIFVIFINVEVYNGISKADDVSNKKHSFIHILSILSICFLISCATYVCLEILMHLIDVAAMLPIEIEFNYINNVVTFIAKCIMILYFIVVSIITYFVLSKSMFVWEH